MNTTPTKPPATAPWTPQISAAASYTQDQLNTYNALRVAAERIAAGIWNGGKNKHKNNSLAKMTTTRGGRSKSYLVIDPDLLRVQQAMSEVLEGTISVNDAMAMLHEYDILHKRTTCPRQGA